MQRARRPVPPPDQLVRDSLAVIEGRLIWAKGAAGNPRRGKEAGTDRPDGRRVVSIRRGSRRSSQLWTIDSTRVAFFLAFEHWLRGVVDFRDGDSRNLRGENLFERERRARSTDRKGGLEAERARDRATLARLAEGVATVEATAQATGVGRSNVSRRLAVSP
jgi:hypothetical protein